MISQSFLDPIGESAYNPLNKWFLIHEFKGYSWLQSREIQVSVYILLEGQQKYGRLFWAIILQEGRSISKIFNEKSHGFFRPVLGKWTNCQPASICSLLQSSKKHKNVEQTCIEANRVQEQQSRYVWKLCKSEDSAPVHLIVYSPVPSFVVSAERTWPSLQKEGWAKVCDWYIFYLIHHC